MQMVGEQRIAATRQRVWEALNDPEVLRQCIPGCQSLEREGDDRFVATAEVKIGPIGARFKGNVALSDLDPPNGYTISGQGSGGVAGSARGDAKVRLADAPGGGTLVTYEVDAQVGGRMAQLGGPIIDATAKQMAGRFFAKFGEIVEGGQAPAAVEAASAPTGAAAPAGAPAPVMAQAAPAPAPAPTPIWGWSAAIALAILAGFLIGRSDAPEFWVAVVAILAVVAATAGYEAGRRSGGAR